MTAQTVILRNSYTRDRAHSMIQDAPDGYVVTIRPPRRSNDQNDKMWALIGDISIAKPEGREHTPEVWKCLFMAACGHAVAFENGLDGKPFPIGFRSSRLTKAEMSDLIETIYEYGARHGVRWSEDG